MVIDPVIGPQQQELFFELNDLLNHVNEEEEGDQEFQGGQNDQEMANPDVFQSPMHVVIPALNESMVNFVPLESHVDELMDEERFEQQLANEVAPVDPNEPSNLHVGLALTNIEHVMPLNLYLAKFFDDPASPWATVFAPKAKEPSTEMLVSKY